MTMTTTDPTTCGPLAHRVAMDLQEAELARSISMLRSFDEKAWSRPTDCPGWDVATMYRHVLGACEAGASMRENVHQLLRARTRRRRHGGPLEAALSAVQVEERMDLGPTQILAGLEDVAPRTIRGRSRTPSVVRKHARMKVDGPVHETWELGYLIDTIYLRDLWMHRIDASRATGRALELSVEHDGRIVRDVVAEWARRHRQPFVLELTGRAGATFASRSEEDGAERLSLDAVEFCRGLAGRTDAVGLLATVVPF